MLVTAAWSDEIADSGDQQALWEIYVSAFSEHRKEAVAEQMVYDSGAFLSALGDPDIRKLVVRADGVIAGFCFMTNVLEKARVNYLCEDFVAIRFPDDYRDRKFFYCTVFAVSPAIQGAKVLFQRVMDEVADLVISNDGRIMFDCSNNINSWLPPAIKRAMERGLIARQKPIDGVALSLVGSQEYWILDLKKHP